MASIGDTVTALAEWLPNATADALAGILVAWDTARQVVRTVASRVADASTQTALNETLARYQDVPLNPAVLADMVIRNLTIPAAGTVTDQRIVTEASYSGLSPERFSAMVDDTGESYGIIDALRLWHQNTYLLSPVANTDTSVGAPAFVSGASLASTYGISEAELDTVIYYSRVRNEFIDDLKRLSWDTMSTADAITTAVKGRASVELAQQLFMAAGGMPEQFELLYESAGDSVGVEHAVELWTHGDITEDQLNAIILQSRINPRFYDVAKLANRKWLSPYQVHQALTAGLVDTATATTWLVEQGYDPIQAAAFAGSAAATKAARVKNESEAMVLADYEAQIITEQDATTALANLGYTAEAIPFVLDTIVARRVLSMRNAAVTRLRTAFVDYLLDDQHVTTDLLALGIPQAAVTQMLTAWTIEQQTNVKRLSAAQVGKLVEENVLTADAGVARWVQMGYLKEEAELLLAVYPPGSKAAAGQTAQPSGLPPTGTPVV